MKKLLLLVALFCLMMRPGVAVSAGIDRQMLEEINLARTAPQSYAGHLRELRSQFVGNGYLLPGSAGIVVTTEGVAALDEALRFLEKQQPLAPLSWSQGLARAAAELVRDEGQSGEVGHAGSRSGDMLQRIQRRGKWLGKIGEIIGYGPGTARLMVVQLIIDDGVPDRGHRKSIFTPGFKVAGAACGPHATYHSMCVMDFAAGFRER